MRDILAEIVAKKRGIVAAAKANCSASAPPAMPIGATLMTISTLKSPTSPRH